MQDETPSGVVEARVIEVDLGGCAGKAEILETCEKVAFEYHPGEIPPAIGSNIVGMLKHVDGMSWVTGWSSHQETVPSDDPESEDFRPQQPS